MRRAPSLLHLNFLALVLSEAMIAGVGEDPMPLRQAP